MSDDITCAACPASSFSSREAYREHCSTAWHKDNLNRRMMGSQVRTQDQYLAANPSSQPAKAEEKVAPADAKEEGHQDKVSKEPAARVVRICVTFRLQGERWSRTYQLPVGTTIMDLKKNMIKSDSPPEDVVSFSLKKGMRRATHFESLDEDETFEFQYVGLEDGQRFLDKDTERKAQEDLEVLERQRKRDEIERETQRLAEKRRDEEAEAARLVEEERLRVEAERQEAEDTELKRQAFRAKRIEEENSRRRELQASGPSLGKWPSERRSEKIER